MVRLLTSSCAGSSRTTTPVSKPASVLTSDARPLKCGLGPMLTPSAGVTTTSTDGMSFTPFITANSTVRAIYAPVTGMRLVDSTIVPTPVVRRIRHLVEGGASLRVHLAVQQGFVIGSISPSYALVRWSTSGLDSTIWAVVSCV
jgi:hypothetical protein